MSIVSCVSFTPTINYLSTKRYLSVNNHKKYIVLTPEEHSNLLTFTQDILSQKTELKFGKKVYLGSLSNLPRHKVKEYFTQNNTQKTSRIEQADSVIIDRNCIERFHSFLTINERNYDLSLYQTYIIEDIKNKRKLEPLVHNYNNNYSIPASYFTP